jgi:arylsulfatase A-like enzyme
VDDALAALLDAVERRTHDQALVVVTADHGEGLGQHHWLEHATNLYDEQIHVPLLVRWPGEVPAGRRIATPVGLVDVAPTVLALAGIESPAPRDGRSLAAAIRGDAELSPLPLFGIRGQVNESTGWGHGVKLSVRNDRWKYIYSSDASHELFDLEADPGEQKNVVGTEVARAAELREALEKHVASLPRTHDAAPLSEDTRRALRALGYLE